MPFLFGMHKATDSEKLMIDKVVTLACIHLIAIGCLLAFSASHLHEVLRFSTFWQSRSLHYSFINPTIPCTSLLLSSHRERIGKTLTAGSQNNCILVLLHPRGHSQLLTWTLFCIFHSFWLDFLTFDASPLIPQLLLSILTLASTFIFMSSLQSIN